MENLQGNKFKWILREQRIKNNLTQLDLAKQLNTSNSDVAMWEKGEVMPDDQMLITISDYFGLTLSALLGEGEECGDAPANEKAKIAKRRLKYNWINLIFDAISIAMIITLLTVILIEYPKLPDIIATHYNSAGVADGWGSKNQIFMHLGLMLGFFALFSILQIIKVRWMINLGLPVYVDTFVDFPVNKDKLYKLMSVGISVFRVLVLQIFFVLGYFHATQSSMKISIGVIMGCVGTMLVGLIVYFVIAFRLVFKWRRSERG